METKTMHIPGPWTAKQSGLAPERSWTIQDARGWHMAAVPYMGWHDAETDNLLEANARLIATAPELLEALVNLMRETDDGTQLCARDFAEAARAAIAKATGSTS